MVSIVRSLLHVPINDCVVEMTVVVVTKGVVVITGVKVVVNPIECLSILICKIKSVYKLVILYR